MIKPDLRSLPTDKELLPDNHFRVQRTSMHIHRITPYRPLKNGTSSKLSSCLKWKTHDARGASPLFQQAATG